MSRKNRNKKAKCGAVKEEQILENVESTHSNSTPTENESSGDMLITLSEDQLMRIISTIVTNVSNIDLTTNKRTGNASTASYSTTDFRRNFSGFTARFNGVVENPDEFETFVDSLIVYKEWASISDQCALRNLPKLLTGKAGKWWQSVQFTITSWDEAIYKLRSMYGAPAYKIFQEIYAEKQGDQCVESFISRAREKFLRLPYRVPEVIQVDIVYGLLNPRIRECIIREDIPADLCTLLARANDVEDMLNNGAL